MFFILMKRRNKQYVHLFILVTAIAVALSFPLKARAEWYVVGYDDEDNPIYINDESVYIKGEIHGAEVKSKLFGRAIFVVNCETSNYYIQTNQGTREGYAAPGTVAGVIADEICEKYN
ncbi:hypothetical protein IQ276_024655 [Desmonostoc muscorum LEGE 12446]|uniref:Uncharacterized protein n=2 Tax=Desmonostoc muscorum TaxID=1179 RepID=A0A8J7A213_DESMC|nr:hypothetical protein [Desmonostoc muscorum LEGE 12446]